MDAIVIQPGQAGVWIVERPEPQIDKPNQVKLRVVQVGICGTDREQVAGGYARAPEGSKELIIGHEVLGQVVAVGPAAQTFSVGDYAVATVRRGCGSCPPCALGRSDMCATGRYRSCGISGLDGFQSEWVVEQASHLVRVPADLSHLAVLLEPLSVVEKALRDAAQVAAARLPHVDDPLAWLAGCRCLVVGLGPIGLLAAMLLRLHNARVYGLDVLTPANKRVAWFQALGGSYIGGGRDPHELVLERSGEFDLVLEAAGHDALGLELLGVLARNGIGVLMGLPGEAHLAAVNLERLRNMVLRNQTLLGSVNASRIHFEQAIDDLQAAHKRWGQQIEQLITRYPVSEFRTVLARRDADEIKAVLEWS